MGFDGFQLIQSARTRIFKIDLAHFRDKNGFSKKLQWKDREFVSATISGAGGANHASQAGSSLISRFEELKL